MAGGILHLDSCVHAYAYVFTLESSPPHAHTPMDPPCRYKWQSWVPRPMMKTYGSSWLMAAMVFMGAGGRGSASTGMATIAGMFTIVMADFLCQPGWVTVPRNFITYYSVMFL